MLNLQAKKLDENETIEINKPVTLGEMVIALSIFMNNRSLGIDGIGIEILKLFWPDLKHYYLELLNKVYNTRQLTESQSNGILSLTGKEKDLLKIKIWGHWWFYVWIINF